METFDLMMMNTRLPPRKRLLAGFLRESSFCEFLPPIPSMSGELGARIREVINMPNSTSDEIIKVAESVALAAAEAAAVARRKAMEKADAAARARANAKAALEVLESVSLAGRAKTRFRKKQVPIKLFYKTSRRAGSQETDEELARRLHHAMNSSPRICNKKKKVDKSLDEVISNCDALCDKNSASTEQNVDGLGENIVVCSQAEIYMGDEEEEEEEEEFRYTSGRDNDVINKKAKNRRKKIMLSNLNVIDRQEPKSSLDSSDDLVDNELKPERSERAVPMEDALTSKDCETTKKITSKWKCKKLRMSQCSSDSKFLHALC